MSTSENIPIDSFVGVPYLACECGDTFEDEASFKTHFELKHTRRTLKQSVKQPKKAPAPIVDYKCGECGKIYPTEEACVEHQEVEHIPYMTELVLGEGEQDIEDFLVPELIVPSSSSQFCSTPSDQSPDVTEKKPKKKRDQRKKVVCETCGKNYSSNAALWYHRKVHLGVKPYKCTYCPKAFTLKLYLQMHIRTHTGEKPYQCATCSKAFSNRGALLRHDLVHTGVKPYQCPKCDKSFKQSNAMKLHYHTVHLKLPTPYKYSRRSGSKEGTNERKPRPMVEGEIKDQEIKTATPDANPNETCYIETPSGRKIALTTIVPKRALQQEYNKVEKAEETETSVKSEPEDEEEEEETYYYVSEPNAEGEEVAYEVIYDTNTTDYVKTTV